MIDFIKIEVKNILPEAIEKHPLLDFIGIVKAEEPDNIIGIAFAYYKGLKFKVCPAKNGSDRKRIFIEGSLHKYWNKGEHNFNDFNVKSINEVIEDIYEKFSISPSNCILKQLEIGVNISPPDETNKIISNCLLHKTKELKWTYVPDEGQYKQVRHENYFIKIYNKQRHYQKKHKEVKPTLRFEIKFTRMRDLHKKGISTLQDLFDFGLYNFKERLLLEWNNILFYDYAVMDGLLYEAKYSNPNYWLKLHPSNFKFHRSKLNKHIYNSVTSIKKQIEVLIADKYDSLLKDSTQNTSYYIGCNQAV